MNGPLDSHFLNMIEQKMENASFARIDADVIDNLINKTEKAKSTLTEEQETSIKELILGLVEKDKYTIQFEALQPTDAPVTISQNEFMRRMKEMSATGGGMYDWMNTMPENFNMIINANHPLVNKVLNISDSDTQKSSMQHIVDLALLEKGMLKGPALTNFVKRNIELMN
jgi:molecular chaperone HtpG